MTASDPGTAHLRCSVFLDVPEEERICGVCGTQAKAKTCAVIYTMVENAKANGVNVCQYLKQPCAARVLL
ncbi:hypothetical protein LI031_30055 [Enterocloster citroniae]|nr:hypothetical protein [Enterocloster citroniae]